MRDRLFHDRRGAHAARPVKEWLALLIFSAIFFAFVLFFSLRPGKITVWIGKIINPIFLLFLAVLVIAALHQPRRLDRRGRACGGLRDRDQFLLFLLLLRGCGTMDAIAGLAFGIVVVDVIRRMGVDNDDAVAVDVLGSGALTGILMAVIYIVTILMGTQSRRLFEISDNGGIAWHGSRAITFRRRRRVILAVSITFACTQGLHRPHVTLLLRDLCQDDARLSSPEPGPILFTLFSFAVSMWV